jgi:hypothetical protein
VAQKSNVLNIINYDITIFWQNAALFFIGACGIRNYTRGIGT